jgi:hypothetical protein
VIEVDRELGDVFPQTRKLVYKFSEENAEFSHDDLSTLVQCVGLDEASAEHVISFLLYYGVLGVRKTGEQTVYIVQPDLFGQWCFIREWRRIAAPAGPHDPYAYCRRSAARPWPAAARQGAPGVLRQIRQWLDVAA